MIRFLFVLLDRLFSPSFERIVSGLAVTHTRLVAYAGKQNRIALRQAAIISDAQDARARAYTEEGRAYHVASRLAALTD